jgi:hypothetical protein
MKKKEMVSILLVGCLCVLFQECSYHKLFLEVVGDDKLYIQMLTKNDTALEDNAQKHSHSDITDEMFYSDSPSATLAASAYTPIRFKV